MNDKIVMLRGPERVRRRPAVIFGDDGVDGTVAAFNMLLDILVSGRCNQLMVTQYLDNSIEIQDNGRGIFFGKGISHWKILFGELYAAPRGGPIFPERNVFERISRKNSGANPLGFYAVCCASTYMDVRVNRGVWQYELHFERGNNKGGLRKRLRKAPSGTYFRFKLDSEVFSNISIPSRQIADKLQSIAVQIPGMLTTFRREAEDGFEETAFCYLDGVADYLQRENEAREVSSPIYHKELTAEGQERYNLPRYAADVKMHVCFAENAGFVKCYHNLKELTCGGTHRDVAIKEIRLRLEWMLECKIDEEDLLKHLQLIIVTKSEHTEWANGARTGLQSIFIRDLTRDTIGDDFHYYVKKNAEFLSALFVN